MNIKLLLRSTDKDKPKVDTVIEITGNAEAVLKLQEAAERVAKELKLTVM